jgi:hypothetical protein
MFPGVALSSVAKNLKTCLTCLSRISRLTCLSQISCLTRLTGLIYHLNLIQDSHISGCCFIVSGQEPKGPQSVVEGHEDDVVLDQVVGPEEVGSASSHDEGSSVDVDHDGAFFVVDLKNYKKNIFIYILCSL